MSEKSASSQSRKLLFISHANPEDNDFALWLSAQLALQGYETWLDLEKLKGGERFWSLIQSTIENETAKFLPIISRASNRKEGVLDEINLAIGVERRMRLTDFVIPLHLDDLPYGEMNIQIQRRNAVRFEEGWPDGLRTLLSKLEHDQVPRCSDLKQDDVVKWWEMCTTPVHVVGRPEVYTSNWFPALMPAVLYQHRLDTLYTDIHLGPNTQKNHVTGVVHGMYLISFSSAIELKKALGDSVCIKESWLLNPHHFLRNGSTMVSPGQARKVLVQLLQQAWDGHPRVASMPRYRLANNRDAYYFTINTTGLRRVRVPGARSSSARQLVGTWHSVSSGRRMKHYWHFGIEVRAAVHPFIGYIVKPHVLFSEDGNVPWEDKERMHKARRTQCRDWWNPAWRDRILASMAWLAQSDTSFTIPTSECSAIEVSLKPVEFVSPLSYVSPTGKPKVDADEVECDHEVQPDIST